MTYFPLSDGFHSMPELLGASDAAVALYARAASWSACHLTDGHVPSAALPMLTTSHEQGSAELVERRVWKRVRGGFQFVGWPREATRSNVEAKREANRRRQEKHRSSEDVSSRRDSRVSNAVTNGVTNGVSNAHKHHTTPLHGSPDGEPPCSPPRAAPRRSGEPDGFAEFYDAYPLHKGRRDAARRFAQVVESGVDPGTLITAARRYSDEVESKDPKYIKHPATWLNKGCWEDEPAPVSQPRMSTRDQAVMNAQRVKWEVLGTDDDDSRRLWSLPGGATG